MAGDIWAKVNYDLIEKGDSGTEIASPTFERKDWLVRWEKIRPIVDLFASAFWIYAVLQVFVFDVDRTLLGLISPGAESLANYRALIFLALLAGAALAGRRLKPQAMVLYVLIFPLVVLLWKLPKTLIKSRSWLTFFSVANVVVDLFGSFRYVAIATATWIFAAVFILATDLSALLIVSMLALTAVLVASFWRTIRFSIRPARFLSFQAATIERVVGSDRLEGIVALSEELQSEDIQVFDSEQQQTGLPPVSTTPDRLGRKTQARRSRCHPPSRHTHQSSDVKQSSLSGSQRSRSPRSPATWASPTRPCATG